MSGTYIAIRDCVTNFMGGHLYKAGEPLMPGDMPNKHFSINGIIPADSFGEQLPESPGDDIRSTDQIRMDLEERFGIRKPANTSRKTLFFAWVQAVKKAEKEGLGQSPATVAGNPGDNQEKDKKEPVKKDPLEGVVLCEMSPDEIEKVKVKEWRDCLQVRYGVQMPAGASKGELADRAMSEEMNASNSRIHDPSK